MHPKCFVCLRIFVFSLTAAACISCSNDSPDVSDVSSSVVFDFKDGESAPEMRLSLFSKVSSEIGDASRMTFEHTSSGLYWETDELCKIEENDRKWIGYSNFVSSEKFFFPSGHYDVTYEDRSEREDHVEFTLIYPNKFLEKKASDFPGVIELPYVSKIAVYSETGELLYFDGYKDSWSCDEDILNDVPGASSTRICYCIENNGIICIMPSVDLKKAEAK